MTILWLNLIIVFTFSFFARYFATKSSTSLTPVGIKPNKILTFGALASLVATAGLRSNIGDTFNYKNIYVENDFTWEYIFSQKDYGFGILQMVLKNYITDDPQIMIFTSALITNVLIVIVFYNYSRFIELSLYVYITGGLFLVSMNGIRQVLAASIAFIAIRFLINGNFIKYSLIILFASTFHQSALVLIPIYFLVRFKARSEEHTSELQSRGQLVCRLLLEKKKAQDDAVPHIVMALITGVGKRAIKIVEIGRSNKGMY